MAEAQYYPVQWYTAGTHSGSQSVPGLYRITELGQVEAHIYDSDLPVSKYPRFSHSKLPEVLHGDAPTGYLTLVAPRIGGLIQEGSRPADWDTRITGDYLILGDTFLEPEQLSFTRVRFRFADQDVWTDWDRYDVKPDEYYPHRSISASMCAVRKFEAVIGNATLALIDDSRVIRGRRHEWTLRPQSAFELRSDVPIPIADIFDSYAYPLQLLLMSASGKLPGLIDMAGRIESTKSAELEGREGSTWYEVFRYHGRKSDLSLSDLRYLHRLADFDFATQVPRVIHAVKRHRLALEHYRLLCSEGLQEVSPAKFTTAIQMVEAFGRTLHPNRKSRDLEFWLKKLEEGCGQPISTLIGSKKWKMYVRELRNLIVHSDRKAYEVTRDTAVIAGAYEMLIRLFEIRLLTEFGMTPDKAQTMVKRRTQNVAIETTIIENYPRLCQVLPNLSSMA